jgi:hypothetical protein
MYCNLLRDQPANVFLIFGYLYCTAVDKHQQTKGNGKFIVGVYPFRYNAYLFVLLLVDQVSNKKPKTWYYCILMKFFSTCDLLGKRREGSVQ